MNNKGGQKLLHEGFMYTKKTTNRSTIRWECSQRAAKKCKGSVTTDLLIQRSIRSTNHSHDPDNRTLDATKARLTLKQLAPNTRATPGQLLADQSANLPVEVRAALGEQQSVKRAIRREKAKAFPPNPQTLQELQLSDDWTTTGDNNDQPFLIHDSKDNNRMLIFASEMALTHLARADTWHMDGTFEVAPLLFQQLFVIRVPLGSQAVSCVYALLPNKTQQTYEAMLTALIEYCSGLGFQPDPTTVITDFELAIINALRTVFGMNIQIHGCFYHLTQSTWRKIQNLGLVPLYRSNEEVKLFCGMLDALAFLPVQEVQEGLDHLKANIPHDDLDPLISYFEATYVTGSYRPIQRPAGPDGVLPPLRMRRIPPLYPPETWNCNQITMHGESRTNNLCESWNNGFRTLVGCAHPSIWRLIDSLRKDNQQVETALLLDSRGECPKKRVHRETKKLQEKLSKLCNDHEEGQKDIIDTLKGVGYCIRWK